MGGRRPLVVLLVLFLPFLAVPATGAGPHGTGLAVSAPERPALTVAVQSPFPGGPQPSAGVPGLLTHLLSTSAEPPSEPPKGRSPEPAREAAMVDRDQARPHTRAEDQIGTRTSEQPHMASPPFTPATATTMLSPWSFHLTWAPVTNLLATRTSHPASPGDPAEATEGGGPEGQEPSAPSLLALGSRGVPVRQASWTGTERPRSPQPGQEPAKGATGATSVSGKESRSLTMEPSWPPGANSPTVQEAEAPSEDRQAMPPVSAWLPLLSALSPGPSPSPMSPRASGPNGDVVANASEQGQPPPHTRSGVLLLMEGRVPQDLPEGHTDSGELLPRLVGENSPPKDRTPGGPSYPGAALVEPPRPSSASPAGFGQVGERRREATLPSRPLDSPQGPPTSNKTLPFQETKHPWGRSSAREGPGGTPHTGPFPLSSAQGGAPLPVLCWGSPSPCLAEEPPASPRAPGGTLTSWPLTSDWHSAGQPSRVDRAPLQSPMSPPAVFSPAPSLVGVLLESPSSTPGKEQGSPEGFRSQGEAGELPPISPWPTAAPQTLSFWREGSVGVPTDSVNGPHQGTGSDRGPQQAWEGTWGQGTTTETAEPPGSGGPGRERGYPGSAPPWTGLLAGLASSSSTTHVPSADPSSCPERHSKSIAASAPASKLVAASTSKMGGTVRVPRPPSVAHHPSWPSSTRAWRWEGRSQPWSPTESQTAGTLHPRPGLAGSPAATRAESLSSSYDSRKRWHPQPPTPTSEPGTRRSRGGALNATPQLGPPAPGGGHPRGHPALVVENQPPLLKAPFLPVPCELVLAMAFSRSFRDPNSSEYRHLVGTINETVTPLFASLPGFQRLEVKTIRPGSVVVEFDALFLPQAPGLWAALNRSSLSERLPPGLVVGNASVLRSVTQERRLDLCALLFSCHAGYECLAQEEGSALCISLCHRDYCKNQGICTHAANHTPVCQCPVGHDFWFLGVHCDYKVTQQGLLGVACGLLLSLVVLVVAVAGLVIRRVRLLLLEAKADQTKSSYRRFCRLDDVSAHYWSEPWLASTTSLDNPAFCHSEELLHLQMLEPACFGCPEDRGGPGAPCGQTPDTPHVGLGAVGQRPSPRRAEVVSVAPRLDSRRMQGEWRDSLLLKGAGAFLQNSRPCNSGHYRWAESLSSINDPMVDSGKASEVSVSSWAKEPFQWSPCPALHKLPRDQAEARAPRPNSCCEGMELVNLERSWTA